MFSVAPLQDNVMVEVSIDKKIHSWSGSIEMGITRCDPSLLDSPFPSSATELREGTWIMSGNSILKVSSWVFWFQEISTFLFRMVGVLMKTTAQTWTSLRRATRWACSRRSRVTSCSSLMA